MLDRRYYIIHILLFFTVAFLSCSEEKPDVSEEKEGDVNNEVFSRLESVYDNNTKFFNELEERFKSEKYLKINNKFNNKTELAKYSDKFNIELLDIELLKFKNLNYIYVSGYPQDYFGFMYISDTTSINCIIDNEERLEEKYPKIELQLKLLNKNWVMYIKNVKMIPLDYLFYTKLTDLAPCFNIHELKKGYAK